VNVRVEGAAEAPALVLIHGLCESLRVWDRMVGLLVDEFRIARVDLLGFGDSPPPRPPDTYGIGDQARGVTTALAAAGVASATLVGHSLGGSVAVAVAEQEPALVKSLVLINSPPTVESRQPSAAEQALRRPLIGEAAWKLMSDRVRRAGLRSAFAPGYEVPQVFVQDLGRTSHSAFSGATNALDAYLEQRPLASRVTALGIPTLVIFGIEDRRVDGGSVALFDEPPNVTVERVRARGHSPMWEQPGTTVSLVKRFVNAGKQ
jgi:pimeloyl-ACP methyl ester carboxylesterase